MSKTIVITGCSTGFGRVTALRLARQSWHVFATVRQHGDGGSLLAEAAAQGAAERLTPVICDITRAEEVRNLAQIVTAATPLGGPVAWRAFPPQGGMYLCI